MISMRWTRRGGLLLAVSAAACFATGPGRALTTAGGPVPAQAAPVAASVAPGASQSAVDQQGDITLNFVGADVRDVAKAILGDYLKSNFEIASGVQGTVTIQTSQPLSRAQVLPAFEQALSLDGLALVKSNGIYQIVPLTDAHRALGAATTSPHAAGYGVEIVPVHYVDAAALVKLLQPLTGSESAIRVDPSRNLLIIEGPAEERQTIVDDIALLDANWLSGMSFELFSPTYMDAEELAKELDQVMGGINGPAAGVVRLVPLDRLNAVLAIAPQQRYLQQLKLWVERLDKPGQGNDKKIFVYHVQNGRANELAVTLIKTLRGSAGTGSSSADITTTPSPQAAPPPTDNLGVPQSHASETAAEPPGDTGKVGYETVEGVGSEGLAAVHITADGTNNALVILATPREYGVIQEALHQLDRPVVQVLLEASIAEVTLNNDTQFGFQYLSQPNSQNQLVLSNGTTSAIAATYPGFSYAFTGSNIQLILNALATKTHVNVISAPEVMVLNNQTARLEVGDEVPILTAQSVGTVGTNAPVVNAVQYMDTGVILKVTPRVNNDGTVMMDISQEVSGVDTTAESTIGSPTIQQRKIDSAVAVQDGETVALGGLFSNQTSVGKSGIPWLQDVPYLGNLFTTTTDQQSKDELMVLITPHVVDDVRKARAITEELRRKLPGIESALDQNR